MAHACRADGTMRTAIISVLPKGAAPHGEPRPEREAHDRRSARNRVVGNDPSPHVRKRRGRHVAVVEEHVPTRMDLRFGQFEDLSSAVDDLRPTGMKGEY